MLSISQTSFPLAPQPAPDPTPTPNPQSYAPRRTKADDSQLQGRRDLSFAAVRHAKAVCVCGGGGSPRGERQRAFWRASARKSATQVSFFGASVLRAHQRRQEQHQHRDIANTTARRKTSHLSLSALNGSTIASPGASESDTIWSKRLTGGAWRRGVFVSRGSGFRVCCNPSTVDPKVVCDDCLLGVGKRGRETKAEWRSPSKFVGADGNGRVCAVAGACSQR